MALLYLYLYCHKYGMRGLSLRDTKGARKFDGGINLLYCNVAFCRVLEYPDVDQLIYNIDGT